MNIFIASYQRPNGEHVTITAYTELDLARNACGHVNLEYGGLSKLPWMKMPDGTWTAKLRHVAYYVHPRILNGVENPVPSRR